MACEAAVSALCTLFELAAGAVDLEAPYGTTLEMGL